MTGGRSMRSLLPRLAVWGCVLSLWVLSGSGAPLTVATFRCNATPPKGEPMIWDTPLKKVQAPLWLKGIVLDDGLQRCVIATLDWCELCNDSELSFRQTLAEATGTDVSRVAIHCVHQHGAPYADAVAHRLLDAATNPPIHLSDKFLLKLRQQMAKAVRRSLKHPQSFDQIGTGQAVVDRVASTRRLRGTNGKIVVRYSTGALKPELASAPEGPIDSKLRTITLARDGRPLVRLHYYATHPQTFACDGRASSDFVGMAREKLEQAEGVFQLYFTGCAGDVTAGKYNDGSAKAQSELAQRLYAALHAAAASTRYQPVERMSWRSLPVALPLREDPSPGLAETRARLADPKGKPGERVYSGAMRLAFAQRLQRPLTVSGLRLGGVMILHLPGEPMLEFQFYAQQLAAQDFLAVAGYFDTGTGYICTDAAYVEGGYEPTASNVGPGSEARLKSAIRQMLDLLSDTNLWVVQDPPGTFRPVTGAADWRLRRAHILAHIELVTGPVPRHWGSLALEPRTLEVVQLPKYTRKRITFRAEPNDWVTAWLLVPNGPPSRRPAMLCLHQTTDLGKDEPAGLGGDAELQYARELAERGYVTLAPDYWPLGAYRQRSYDPYHQGYASGTMKGLWNHIRSLDYLQSLPEVNANRLGAIGHSLGGHNALYLAALDERIKVAVSSCGFCTFASYAASAYGKGDLRNWSQRCYLPRIAERFANDPRQVPFDWPEVLAAIAPRAVFVNAPLQDENFVVAGVRDCVQAALPVFELLRARAQLVAVHPDAGHSFPRAAREQAYAFVDRVLQQ